MPRTAQFAEQVVEVAQQIVQKAMTARELRTRLSIIIPKEYGVSNEVAAKALNIGIATVVRMQQRIRDQVDGKEEEKSSWGGRRRQTMSIEEASGFLRPWVEKAETGGVLLFLGPGEMRIVIDMAFKVITSQRSQQQRFIEG